jgi:hypothetical protein
MIALPRLGAVVLAAVLTASCGTALRSLPQGPGTPTGDVGEALAEATATCRRISTLTAEVGISGSVNGQRVRGRVLTGVAAPASIFLDAAAPFGASYFLYTARGDRATLLLPRDARVLQHGDPAAVLEAVAGVPLDAAELRSALTGCVLTPTVVSGRQYGGDWRVAAGENGESYLHRSSPSDRWRVVAVRRTGPGFAWRADYFDFEGGVPRTVRLVSAERRRFDLTLSLSQVEIDAPLGPEVFELKIPASAVPISIEELRRAGPFGAPGSASAGSLGADRGSPTG